MKICIVGFGAAGILLFLNLVKNKIPPHAIHIFDPYFDGGDLRRKWPSVRSNTTWRQVRELFPDVELVEPWSTLDPDQPCELKLLIEFLLKIARSKLEGADIHTQRVESIEQDHLTKQWKVATKKHVYQYDILFLTTGSEPKSLDLPYPSIPLEFALSKDHLQDYIQPGETIALFGSAHSGVLIAENLTQCSANIVFFYATPKPFSFDKDGEYDGLKQDAAEIAEKILQGQYPNIELVSIQDIGTVLRKSKSITKTIFAIGFESRQSFGLQGYDGITGKLQGCENAWGFGIAYPNQAPDGTHWDVSIPAFDKHIQKQIPDILSLFGIEG